MDGGVEFVANFQARSFIKLVFFVQAVTSHSQKEITVKC